MCKVVLIDYVTILKRKRSPLIDKKEVTAKIFRSLKRNLN